VNALFFDCFSGISGDMILGSLLDLGLPLEHLSAQLSKLNIKNYQLSARRITKSHIAATKFDVEVGHEHAHRGYQDIAAIFNQSDLSTTVKERANGIFYRLAEVEAKIHGSAIDQVHFHEVGAVDAIVDIAGACIALEGLGIERVYSSALNVGRGFVETAHGNLPVPAPATLELLRGVPVYSNQVQGELVTPTGAAVLTSICHSFGPLPHFRIEKVGYGAGSRDSIDAPNVLRVLQGEVEEHSDAVLPPSEDPSVLVVEANIDDMNPQIFGYLQEKLLAMGVLDVFVAPVQMKKNRPGTLLTVIVSKELLEPVSALLFEETTSIGVRYHEAQRKTLVRSIEEIQSAFGKVAVKVSRLNGKIINFSPEYEDCRRLALEYQVPYKWIQSQVIQTFMNLHAKETQ
jgi:pyridinium-3,5-bisthiocarboxylic acid mononucleotide nickel chelatase